MSKVDFDHYANEYERLAANQTRLFDADSGYFARYKVELMQRISGLARGAILDFGCGIGRSLPHLRTLFPELRHRRLRSVRRKSGHRAQRLPGR